MSLKRERWFVQDGSVFSDVVKKKTVIGFKDANQFNVNESVMFNVGNDVAKHVVELHNAWLDKQV